jgi:hypothetical protein
VTTATIPQVKGSAGYATLRIPQRSRPRSTKRQVWQHVCTVPSYRTDWCEFPNKLMNIDTGEEWLAACGSARSSKCRFCAEVKRGDVASISRSGWTDKPTDRGVWLTLTAPGQKVLPWDRDKCVHPAGMVCAGNLGCKASEVALALWHSKMAGMWTHFITELRRTLDGNGPHVEVEFVKTYEPQLRGALHIHSMMRTTGVCSQKRFEDAVTKAANLNGFGPQIKCEFIDLANDRTVARIAGYLSKYTTKCADALQHVEVINKHTGEFKPCTLRNWSASARWGDRMWETKQRRIDWARDKAATDRAQAASDLDDGGALLDLYQDLYALTGDVPCANVEEFVPLPL